ncbi:hypothetical protein [Streptomyces sp. NPDC003456]|uniref:hypothetical protein n=1 Tax=Streptomyces sp. NPDC003456 TaxID=3364683 RepID=UPI0036B44586
MTDGTGGLGLAGCAAVRAQVQVSAQVGESGFPQGTGGGRPGGPGAGTGPDGDAGRRIRIGEPEPGADQRANGAATGGVG